MTSPIHSRRFRHRLARFLFAGSGLVAAPAPAVAAQAPETPDAEPDERDEGAEIDLDEVIDTGGDATHVFGARGRRLATRLARMNPFDATWTAATAALSPSVRVRRAIAEALVSPFPLVGDDFVLGELVRDPDLDVRAAGVRACATRGLAGRGVSQPPRVLVIDDYPGGRAALCACLSDLGCDVMGASTKIASRDIAWRDLVDVVIANHDPPWCDGEKVIADVRRHAPDLPAIVLRYPATRVRDDPVPTHGEVMLVKPLVLDDLAKVIRVLAPNHRDLG